MKGKVKIQLEYPVRSPKRILYSRLSTPNGLNEWFADKVVCDDECVYTFNWSDQSVSARLIDEQKDKRVRFQWLEDEGEEYYFEFELETNELSSDTSLIITDFVEEHEEEDAVKLWNEQITVMMRKLGVN